MATKLTKPVIRELPEPLEKNRQYIVTVTASGIDLRPKNCRYSYQISWEGILWKAITNKVEHDKKEKKQQKLLKKAGLA